MFSTVGDCAAEDGDGGGMVVADLLGLQVTSSRVTSSGFEMMFVDGVSSTTLLGNTDRGGERDRPGRHQGGPSTARVSPPARPQDPAPAGDN